MTPRAPKSVMIKGYDGTEKEFIIDKFPATVGVEILAKGSLSALPKVGEYPVFDETMLKALSFVAVPTDTGMIWLSTRALVDNHIPDAESIMRLLVELGQYNYSFFQYGTLSTFFGALGQKVLVWITKTLIPSLAQSLPKDAPRSKS